VNNRKGAKGLIGIWRDWGEREEFGPVLLELTVEEMERREQERTREARWVVLFVVRLS
jgi:chromatin structure-remodeling complex subunit SFH1